jgi:hypothetical protein
VDQVGGGHSIILGYFVWFQRKYSFWFRHSVGLVNWCLVGLQVTDDELRENCIICVGSSDAKHAVLLERCHPICKVS